MLKLGITGGIGCGKSTVCKVFRVLGIPVFSADRVAREIQDTDPVVREELNEIAQKDLYINGQLDRMELAFLIFNNREMLDRVDKVVHPAVFSRFTNWLQGQSAPYVIMEAAILFESGASRQMDIIATIAAPEEERISRVISRSNLTREQVVERIRNQMDDESRIRLSDYVINNSENDMIIPAILEIHSGILKKLKF
jgi:dephospho-CoA kinase